MWFPKKRNEHAKYERDSAGEYSLVVYELKSPKTQTH